MKPALRPKSVRESSLLYDVNETSVPFNTDIIMQECTNFLIIFICTPPAEVWQEHLLEVKDTFF